MLGSGIFRQDGHCGRKGLKEHAVVGGKDDGKSKAQSDELLAGGAAGYGSPLGTILFLLVAGVRQISDNHKKALKSEVYVCAICIGEG